MHCGNTNFIYHEEFSKYMKVEGAMLEDVFDYLFDLGAKNFLSEKEKKYLHELFEKWDLEHLEMMMTLMMDLNTMLEMKASRISRMTSLVRINLSEKLQHQHVIACQVSS